MPALKRQLVIAGAYMLLACSGSSVSPVQNASEPATAPADDDVTPPTTASLDEQFWAGVRHELDEGAFARAQPVYERGCDGGHGPSCYRLGMLRWRLAGGELVAGGWTVEDGDAIAPALDAFRQACEVEHQSGCSAFLQLYKRVKPATLEMRAAYGRMAEWTAGRCSGGWVGSCYRLGYFLELEPPVNWLPLQQEFEARCKNDSYSACRAASYAHFVQDKQTYHAWSNMGRDLADARCRAGDAAACMYRAREWGGGHAQFDAAVDGYFELCKRPDKRECIRMYHRFPRPFLHPDENGLRQQLAWRLAACAAGVGDACSLASDLVASGKGADKDPQRAKRLAQEACEKASYLGCSGAKQHRRACALGFPFECLEAGELAQARGEHAAAKRMYSLACAGDEVVSAGCDRAK